MLNFKFIIFYFFLMGLFCHNSIASGKNEIKLDNYPLTKDDNFHVTLSVGVPVPFVSGYFIGIEGMLGIEFIKKYELLFKLRKEGISGLFISNDQHIFQSQFVYYGIQKDLRSGNKGWTKKYGLMLGYALRAGDNSGTAEEDGYEHYERLHFLTAGLIFKAIYWWRNHLGLFMSVSALGGVSFYSYITYYGNTSTDGCLIPKKDAFAFGDSFLWELGFHIGLAF